MSAMNGIKKTSGWLNRVLWSFAACLLTLSPVAHGVETVTYYHLDALGSTVAATDDGGNVLWRETYKPYGERLNGQDEAGWYTGKAYDEDIGLNYFGARWYHPELGRFMADDPVGFDESNPQSFNRYAYANNNPYRYVDPDGRESILTAAFRRGCNMGCAINESRPLRESTAVGVTTILLGADIASDGINPTKLLTRKAAKEALEKILGRKPTKKELQNFEQEHGISSKRNTDRKSKARKQEAQRVGGGAEHMKGKRKSTRNTHQEGASRKQADQDRARQRRE